MFLGPISKSIIMNQFTILPIVALYYSHKVAGTESQSPKSSDYLLAAGLFREKACQSLIQSQDDHFHVFRRAGKENECQSQI